jgi:hypothetical protein
MLGIQFVFSLIEIIIRELLNVHLYLIAFPRGYGNANLSVEIQRNSPFGIFGPHIATGVPQKTLIPRRTFMRTRIIVTPVLFVGWRPSLFVNVLPDRCVDYRGKVKRLCVANLNHAHLYSNDGNSVAKQLYHIEKAIGDLLCDQHSNVFAARRSLLLTPPVLDGPDNVRRVRFPELQLDFVSRTILRALKQQIETTSFAVTPFRIQIDQITKAKDSRIIRDPVAEPGFIVAALPDAEHFGDFVYGHFLSLGI